MGHLDRERTTDGIDRELDSTPAQQNMIMEPIVPNIPPRELAIGNWVLFTETNTREQVGAILGTQVGFVYPRILAHLDRIEPIELTGDILLKSGFQRSNIYGYREHLKYTRSGVTITALFGCDFSILLHESARVVRYVHELQNIWYFLKREELNVKF